jgi:hypothetical protein
LPVTAFDLGAIAERLRAAGVGMLLPLELNPRQINDRLLQLAAAPPLAGSVVSRSVQTQHPRPRDGANMAATHASELHMDKPSNGNPTSTVHQDGLSASVQVLPLPAGLYLFSVKSAQPPAARANGQLSLPAVHVGLGPGVRTDQVEFIAGPSTHGAWLFAQGDLLVTRVNASGATLVMTSVRAPGGEVLSIKVERLDSRTDAAAAAAGMRAPKEPIAPVTSAPALPLQIRAHIRTRGDMSFAEAPWAGRIAPGLWIESFSVRPLQRFGPQDVEYKALTASGFETPWHSDDSMCGTKGMAVPLVGFAVRLKPSAMSAAYDCEYSGYFKSGVTVGPLRNGAPCRSTVANDPLEGIQVQLLKRSTLPMAASAAPGAAVARPARPMRASVKPRKRAATAHHTPKRGAPSTRHHPTRRP